MIMLVGVDWAIMVITTLLIKSDYSLYLVEMKLGNCGTASAPLTPPYDQNLFIN